MNIRVVVPLLLLDVAVMSAQSAGPFTATGSMIAARSGHTATLLPSGRVLIAGGTNDTLPFAAAELYDPSTGAFVRTGDMNIARFGHTATLLPTGLVLIAGGYAKGPPFSTLASAEVYDPSSGTFAPAGNMTVPRSWHSAILLNDGRVLLAGGFEDNPTGPSKQLVSSEVFNPVSGTFTPSGNMVGAPEYPGSGTLLANGKVLLGVGAFFGQFDAQAVGAQLYDPATGTFSLTGASTHPYGNTASLTSLTNGEVLRTLSDGCDADNEAELYDPSVGTFRPTGNMTAFRDLSTGVLLPDGTVLIAGGSGAGDALDGGAIRAELYNPAKGAFSLAGRLTEDRYLNTATLLSDGTVLIAGGTGWKANFQCCVTLASAELYHPAVLVPAPVLLSLSGDGRGPGAILHGGTHQVVSTSNPALAGEALEIYGAGLTDGSVIPPQVAIGGRMAELLFFGKAPGFSSLNQVNVRVPSGVAPGPAVSVRLNYLNRPSNEVTIGVQ